MNSYIKSNLFQKWVKIPAFGKDAIQIRQLCITLGMAKPPAASAAAGGFYAKEDRLISISLKSKNRKTCDLKLKTYHSVRSEGSTGIAPFLVQTNADVRTAIE